MPPSLVPAKHGLAIPLSANQILKIINTHGTQVIDTWAFTASSSDITSQMSMEHTRASLQRTIPKVGDSLYSNERKKILTITEDTTSGVHDTLIAACDRFRYHELGVVGALEGAHRNCADNLIEGLSALGIKRPQFTPSPLNLFMNIPVHEDRTTLSFEPPVGTPGEYVCLKAEMDCVVVLSACPQDILKINGGEPKDANYEIFEE